MSELATIERSGGRAMIVADALTQESEQRKLLGEYIAKHMHEGTDYGIIPGTQRKNADGSNAPTPKTLLKPGAEKLTQLYRTIPKYTLEDKIENWDTGLFYYRYVCRIVLQADEEVSVAEGVGSANSYESRYRWRKADRACPACGANAIKRSKYPPRNNPTAQPGWYCYDKAGGCGANYDADDASITGQTAGRVQNPDILDTVNTVLKIAKKRALVDAAIALARCSDIFTQDVEDFHGDDHESQRGNYDPRTVPGVKSGADLDQYARWRTFFNDQPDLAKVNAMVPEWKGLSREASNGERAPRAVVWSMFKDYAANRGWSFDSEAFRFTEGKGGSDPPKNAAAPSTANAGDAGSPSPSAGAASAKTARRKPITKEALSDLVTATAERTGTDELVLLIAMLRDCSKRDDIGIDDLTAEEMAAAEAWLRGQPSAKKEAAHA